MDRRKIWAVEPGDEDIFAEALYLFKQEFPTAHMSNMVITPKTWTEYEYRISSHTVKVCLRGAWWKKQPDPLGLNEALFPKDCNAMLNIGIEYSCGTRMGIYFHSDSSFITEGWKEEALECKKKD